ncbi:MAG TPA: hypothetical protein VJP85_15440 [Candidatus Baltobacteraceae bacterium]|nr:hypothetical protein [Candidatus Baltobacteraceae bacterium]
MLLAHILGVPVEEVAMPLLGGGAGAAFVSALLLARAFCTKGRPQG